MPLLPKGASYSAQIADAPIFAGRNATAQDFGAPGLGETGLVEAGHKVTATAKAQIADMEESEARQALIASTEVRAEYSRKLDEAALSGADVGKLKEEMNGALSKIGEQFQTKKGTEQLQLYSANSEIMYDQQANAIKVQRAWSDARMQGQKFLNGAAALIASSPTYLVEAEKNAADFVASYPGIRPDQRAQLTDDLQKSLNGFAAQSAARINPAETIKKLDEGAWNLTPEQRHSIRNYAEQEQNGQRKDAEIKRLEVQRVEREQVDMARSKYVDLIAAGKASWPAIRDDPAFKGPQGADAKKELFIWMDARRKALAGEERKGDRKVEVALFLQYAEGKIFSDKYVTDAVRAHSEGKPGLDLDQGRRLMAEVARLRDSNYQAVAVRAARLMGEFGDAASRNPLVQGLAAADPNLIPELQMTYRTEVDQKMEALRKKDIDPRSVFDPKSEHYVGPGAFTQEIFDRVLKAKKTEIVADATNKGAVDLRRAPDAWKTLKVGDFAIMPDGTPGKVTAQTLAILKQQAASVTFPYTPSGETPDKVRQREQEEQNRTYRRTMGLPGGGE